MQAVDPDVVVRRLEPSDWQLFREIRLRALAESPAAFGSTLAEASRLGEADWRERLAGRAQFMAIRGPDALGTAAGIATDAGAELISMWVDPRARGHGVGDRLVGAVLGWATGEAHGAVALWVAEGNLPAERLYRRHGFRRTGAVKPMTDERPDRREFEMGRVLEPGDRTQVERG
ncbi:MAG: GNAT family N-acetyltransferase [Candidatus Dormibacter sp.]